MSKKQQSLTGANIKDALDRRGMSVAELSRRSGVSYRTLHNVMHNRSDIRSSTLGKIANALNCDYEDLHTRNTKTLCVKEKEEQYESRTKGNTQTVNEAIETLAMQFGVDKGALKKKFFELIVKMMED